MFHYLGLLNMSIDWTDFQFQETKSTGRRSRLRRRRSLFGRVTLYVRFACRDPLVLRGVHACAMGRHGGLAHDDHRGRGVHFAVTPDQYQPRELPGNWVAATSESVAHVRLGTSCGESRASLR